jgi:hypothetical protein
VQPDALAAVLAPAERAGVTPGLAPWCKRHGRPKLAPMSPRAVKVRSQPHKAPASPADFDAWHAQAAAILEREHGTRAAAVPHRVWALWFISHLTPAEAARHAEAYVASRRVLKGSGAVAAAHARPVGFDLTPMTLLRAVTRGKNLLDFFSAAACRSLF